MNRDASNSVRVRVPPSVQEPRHKDGAFYVYIHMEFTVYILYSFSLDSYYIGQTNDVSRRLERHNAGYVKSTKRGRPWKLDYVKSFETRSESMAYETYIKSMKSKVYIKELIDMS